MEVVVETTATKEEVVQKKGIVEMYNEAANMWDELWGEHQHEGFYDTDSPVSGLKSDHKLAQTRMIQEALLFAGFSSVNASVMCSSQDIKTADWTPHVAPFATALVQSSSRPRVGPKTTKGANMTPLMVEGYEMGLIKYAIITCRKPQ
ncbi:hypothetical protein Tsubulata_040796 [Turnera subulata]|uniref:Uncharacterized protein n=1 Tax=Turnera subulata TaxID=218843 RepID=A0A9Q0GDW8_9ROSI|nr:hypothetical protein Tsubulata_040796 [Turnera subulata]